MSSLSYSGICIIQAFVLFRHCSIWYFIWHHAPYHLAVAVLRFLKEDDPFDEHPSTKLPLLGPGPRYVFFFSVP